MSAATRSDSLLAEGNDKFSKKPSNPAAIRLGKDDDVLIARCDLEPNARVETITVVERIPAGHKIAARSIAVGDPVRRYGQIIGFASQDIPAGAHVHVHNLKVQTYKRDYRFGEAYSKTELAEAPATFQGIVRANGEVATRNYIGILSTVNCSATIAKYVAAAFKDGLLKDFPEVDGIVALTHTSGCAMDIAGEGITILRRTLAGYARHPNFAAVLIIGLGCEANQLDVLKLTQGLNEGAMLRTMVIQDLGGTASAVREGIRLIHEMLLQANAVRRQLVPAKHLLVGLQCGGSDGYSGITANPALGFAVDRLVQNGGTAILSETPEIYGAEHLLTARAANQVVGEKLINRIRWWEDYTRRNNGEMNNNPSPGNKAGGLTTILEKSLGAVAKGGSTGLMEVYEYAEAVRAKGFVFMDTPGYDPVSATGQVAGGANLICFTTGRGSVYGCKPTPSLKIATNSELYCRMTDDMDFDAGQILDGRLTVQQAGDHIFELMLTTASGQRSKSEQHGFGEDEFVPWQLGAVM